MKAIIYFLIICFLSPSMILAQNPKSVCSQCGNFDLAKVTFTENIDDLCAKTSVSKMAIVNSNLEEKDESDIVKKDVVKAYSISFLKDKKDKSNKDFIVYENLFKFKNIKFLTNSKKEIVVFDAYSFYEGQMKDIDNLISKLNSKFKKSIPKKGKLIDAAIVHQWKVDDVIIQLQNDTKQEKETEYSNGKEIVKYTCYVRLSIFNIKRIDTDIKKYLKNKSDFVLFGDENYVK